MTTRTFHTVSNPATSSMSSLGAQVSAALQSMGPNGRRWALAGVGAACALGLGAAAATMVQLPADMKEPIQAQEQSLVQSELPSETQARANALNNPPAYRVDGAQNNTDAALVAETPVETTTAFMDDKPTGPTVTTNTTDDDDAPAEPPVTTPAPASAPAQVSASPVPKDADADPT